MNSLHAALHYLVDRTTHPSEAEAGRAHDAIQAHAEGFDSTESYLVTKAAEAAAKDPDALQRQLQAALDNANEQAAKFEQMNKEAMEAVQRAQAMQEALVKQQAELKQQQAELQAGAPEQAAGAPEA